jgi:hypothetical protein
MKLLLLIGMFLIGHLVTGQYFEFPDSNAIWSVSNKKYFIQGDSVLNSIEYRKVYVENDSVISLGSFYALIREDSNEKKIYAIHKDSINEHLLYDFSLDIGDEAIVFPLESEVYSGPVSVKVDSVDSIYIYDDYRRKLHISGVEENDFFSEEWIEGIGSSFGLFGSGLSGIVIFDAYYPFLLCYEQNNNLLYNNPDFLTCYEPQVSTKKNLALNQVNIYPNPALQYLIVETFSNQSNYIIKSINGKIMKQGTIKSMKEIIDVSDMMNGDYFIQLITERASTVRRFIILNQ